MITSHNILKPSEARCLLDRFDQGLTTLDEEKSLFDFFHQASLPADLARLRPLMAWYEGGCVGTPAYDAKVDNKRRFNLRPLLSMAAAVAAIAVVAISAWIMPRDVATSNDDFFAMYAGSYVIRNGVKVSDPNLIRDDILRCRERIDSVNALVAASTDTRSTMENHLRRRLASSPLALQAAINIVCK
ncbi:MAG: hypothetical protein NC342_06940 [Pseudoflavonifractor sp.]|nr:hypothetical protein [Pseudoflavonifractor sp.]